MTGVPAEGREGSFRARHRAGPAPSRALAGGARRRAGKTAEVWTPNWFYHNAAAAQSCGPSTSTGLQTQANSLKALDSGLLHK